MNLVIIDTVLLVFVFCSFWAALALVYYLHKFNKQKEKFDDMLFEITQKTREAKEISKDLTLSLKHLEHSLQEQIEKADSLKTDLILFIQKGDKSVKMLEKVQQEKAQNELDDELEILNLSNPKIMRAWK